MPFKLKSARSSALVFGEVPSPGRFVGMALILGGLAVIVLPAVRVNGSRRQPATHFDREDLE